MHPLPSARDDHVLKFLGRAFANDGRDRGVRDQNLVHRHATRAICFLQKQLGKDTAQRIGEHRPGLRLFRRRKNVDHSVDRFAGVVGVERSKHEKAGFGRSQRERNGFQIAHFANQHDVGVFAQRGLQRDRKGFRVAGNFALGDDTALVVMHELDRFLDRHDVARKVLVNVIHQRGQGR